MNYDLHRFIELYKEGRSALEVMEKIKEVRKRHRTPLLLEKRPFVSYNRDRGRQLNFSEVGDEEFEEFEEEEEEE